MVFPIAAAMGAVGALGGGLLNFWGQHQANKMNWDIANATNFANAQQARALMQWQERMSNTAWQRGVADMRKAGINPILAASQGGAGTPPGASIPSQIGNPMQNPLSGAVDAFNSAINYARTRSDIALQSSQVAKTNASTALDLLKQPEARVKSRAYEVANVAADAAINSAKHFDVQKRLAEHAKNASKNREALHLFLNKFTRK
mgnify:CR=1 FL=1